MTLAAVTAVGGPVDALEEIRGIWDAENPCLILVERL
jgi:hypothetical protein